MRKALLLFGLAVAVGCGGGGGGGTPPPPPPGDQNLPYAAPVSYGGTVDAFPTDQSCSLVVFPDPNDLTKPKPLSGPNDTNCLLTVSGTGGVPGRINGTHLQVWGVDQFVSILKKPDGRIQIVGIKPGSGNEIAINVVTPGEVINPPPPVP